MDDHFPNLTGITLAQRYQLTEEIGRGGFGVVYRAYQMNMDREVAIKILPPQFMAIPDVVERFKREAKLASKLRHHNSITIHDYGQQDNLLYIVMELLEGEDLADILQVQKTIKPERIMHIAKQVLKSLAEAHDLGIIHRDLKPENIFLNKVGDETDFVKVLDFGIAKLALPQAQTGQRQLTVTGSTVGTPVYMSPEQAAGEEVGTQTDLYALGVIMYEMACGHPPFQDENPVKIMRSHLFYPVPPLSNPALRNTPLERVILKALEKETHLRYQNAREMARDIDPAPSQIMAVPPSLMQFSSQYEEMDENSEPTMEILFDRSEWSESQQNPSLSEDSAESIERKSVNTSSFGAIPNHRSTNPNTSLRQLSAPDINADHVPFQRLGAAPKQAVMEGASTSSLLSKSGLLPSPQPAPMRPQELGNVSSILTIVEGPNDQASEEIILLTRPKTGTNPAGNTAVAPTTNPNRSSFEPPESNTTSNHSQDIIPLTKRAPSTQEHSRPDISAAQPEDEPSEDIENWSWGDPNASMEIARQVESGAYPQLQKKKTAPVQTKSKAPVLLIVVLVLIALGLVGFFVGLPMLKG